MEGFVDWDFRRRDRICDIFEELSLPCFWVLSQGMLSLRGFIRVFNPIVVECFFLNPLDCVFYSLLGIAASN